MSFDRVIGEVHAHEPAMQVRQTLQHSVDAIRLSQRVARLAADDDASMLWRVAMQPNEMQTVVR